MKTDQTERFLSALFAEKDPGEHLLIWTLDDRRSAWFSDVSVAAEYVRSKASRDVYVGVALSPKNHGPTLRLKLEGDERMPSSIAALWADIDIADTVHRKKNLAPSIDDARTILFPDFPPSLLLHSGGGLQAWWIFKELWKLESEQEIRQAGALATRWIRAIRARAAARGWDIDSVGDLARVMRVPATSNCKIPGHPRPVQLIEENAHRYNPSDLDEYLDMIGAERVSAAAAQLVPGEKLQYSSDAEPPFQRFQVLCDVEPLFKSSWEHFRRDLKDQTASAYDMALANLAAQAGWTDQEIANLLIAHRRRHKEDLKLRDSYYAKTISKARSTFPSGDLIREIEDLITPEPQATHDDDGEKRQSGPDKEDPLQKKASLVDRISKTFNLTGDYRIVRVIKFTSDPPEFAIEIADSRRIRLGGVENLLDPHALQMKIAALAGRMIPSFKKNAEWAKIQQGLLDACIDVHIGEEGTNEGLAGSWLRGYLSAKSILESVEESDDTRAPFTDDGRIHVYLSDFRRWVHINHGDRIAPKEMGILLRAAGAVPMKVSCGKTTRQVWQLSETFVPPSQAAEPDRVAAESEVDRAN